MALEKIKSLRALMSSLALDALIVPTADPHQSEYLPDFWKTRAWLTGFTGSAGTAVITKNHAGLWTDSRYFIQAENELLPPFVLHKLKKRTPEYLAWLLENLEFGNTLGIDASLFSADEVEYFNAILAVKQIKVQAVGDVFEKLWTNRPPLVNNPVFIHDEAFTGKSRVEKIEKVRSQLINKKATHHLLSALDEIAWLLNIRGNDIEFNPVVTSYCLVSHHKTLLFIDAQKLSNPILETLNTDGIFVQPYEDISQILQQLNNKHVLWCNKAGLNHALFGQIDATCNLISEASIVSQLKAVKNPVEINHYKQAQIRDGVAMCNFLHWLEKTMLKKQMVSELDAARQVMLFRQEQKNYMGPSFNPISAYQANAALPHYSATVKNNTMLKPEGIYLIDSGGQYLDGTTDITRTVALGPVTNEQKTNFTLVLKGHIRVATTTFPEGTKGIHIDTLARLDLWRQGKDFGHGTGHGIGYFLNVHEGPQGLSPSSQGPGDTVLESGMMLTNEPGFYLKGAYGIRIENVLVCKPGENTGFLQFETITYCPLDKNLIKTELLNEQEIIWINNYHQNTYRLLKDKVSDELKSWLQEKTSPLY
ncbi:MAG: peptidase M24 [Bacteroidetes bacterium HGW-Bacteroidetes-4]|jgi:Xaa-Pro aminopeptidase|nr:MAG: peptidase M24 [Bacteroidetes bacterium HGW-Bacteroidetes-4]